MADLGRRCRGVEPLLSAWLDGALRPGERGVVAEHLPDCSRCRTEVESLRVTRSLLRSGPLHALPEHVDRAARVGAQAPMAGGPVAPPRRIAGRVAAGMVAATALLGGTAFAVGGEPDSGPSEVAVPLDVFVADHLVRTAGMPVTTQVLFEGGP